MYAEKLSLLAKQQTHVGDVVAIQDSAVAQVALLLLGLLGQDVALESVTTLDLTCSGKGEPFFGTGISFNFRHFLVCF